MVPGIDLAGTVRESSSAEWKAGAKVVLNGWGVGEMHWGGLAQVARLKGEWLVPLSPAFTQRQAMAIGTAGYTAALCVDALVNVGVTPDQGEVLVTGATGGVGSVAVALLKAAGFTVVAATGKSAEGDYLAKLGADSVIDRATLSEKGKPLQKERWAGVVDAVGSFTLDNACAQTRYGGAVAACGLAQGADFPATVMPFILRGVRLLGVDSVMAPRSLRVKAYERLARDLDAAALESIATEIALADAPAAAADLVAGKIRGRVVVDVNR
jgi:acrylyl-CoA reductase (NADPH)